MTALARIVKPTLCHSMFQPCSLPVLLDELNVAWPSLSGGRQHFPDTHDILVQLAFERKETLCVRNVKRILFGTVSPPQETDAAFT